MSPAPLSLPPEPFAAHLAAAIAQGLPGRKCQTPFAPQLSFGRHFGPPAREAREAAVLILLYPRGGEWHVPTILRPPHMKAHADQVALPGGMVEAGESSQQSALREYEEELGASRTGIRILGELSPIFVYVSNVLVRPHLAICFEPPVWQPNPAEVAEIIEVPLRELYNPAARGTTTIERRGLNFTAPHFQIGQRRIWGATCMMLAELAALIEGCQS
jgi:8-oxo-dGTP pyrophosphatase MutT (NUDIX family)